MRRFVAFLAVTCLALAGCANVAQVAANVAQATSTATPNQVTTLGDAVAVADGLTNATDVYATSGHPSRAVANQLSALSDGLHAAVKAWEGADAAHQSLAMASFNAALQAYNAYATSAGVKH